MTSELQRLLGTAKDKDRQELIRDAIQSLSVQRGSLSQSYSPSNPNGTSSVSHFTHSVSIITVDDLAHYAFTADFCDGIGSAQGRIQSSLSHFLKLLISH